MTSDSAIPPAIAFRDVVKTWPQRGGDVTALDHIDLDVPSGGITGVIGRSGAGKSTLLRLVNGLERVSSGRVELLGRDVSAARGRALRALRRDVGMIFQHFNLLANRTVRGNVALPLEIAGMPRTGIHARVDRLIELVGLGAFADRYPAQLSGGQKQRVGIARALATEPRVLLSDEATSALDPETTQAVLALLRDINRELGLTILLITHEMAVVRDICQHVAVMEAGRIVETGATYDIFADPQHPVTRSFLSGVTGTVLPGFLARQIVAHGAGPAILRITFSGDSATHPVLSRLGAKLGIDVNILGGAIEEIDGRPFGNLTVQMPAEALPAAQAYLHAHQLRSEVIGHVG
ncbi:ATP-binding cassette domain-containing protein [Paracoccus stylophorae]|uniref:ATP-binding cassette domain-containing protein n=1 Tax=Paracoccus stylophorae TaxID=659350 RepID=A0ABY7SWX1_9RHOB|nr:ATP-binding cassette domain-containing protein [Paracoccus stylophorae]WCR11522.1 ATP-binding cassette domain-containing protein [Paracoccus stylophorae]